ncbi:hypothetical protein [Aureimonas pseudogalii]|uniref:Uncharacterized protein n=1 Tax=Aureimonas pseudogalii TaxID=1744844 RepID=A0A7W6H321_9HYPH|nr:hypothetical protein [Aureimonas pseudogalii]MBB3996707.1 hypothetical protein [Aureimonas pseudogalii]
MISEAFQDLLKSWSRQNGLHFISQYEFAPPQKNHIRSDGTILHDLRVPLANGRPRTGATISTSRSRRSWPRPPAGRHRLRELGDGRSHPEPQRPASSRRALAHPGLAHPPDWLVRTHDAGGARERRGFAVAPDPEAFMIRRTGTAYRTADGWPLSQAVRPQPSACVATA